MDKITERLVEFAQKLYDDHKNVADVKIYPSSNSESVLVIFDAQGREDKYWVNHSNPLESQWTWVRQV